MEKIFEPFFTLKRKGKGTGMGLSVVHGIVKSYGGAIQVSSIKGKGSIFRVYFPRETKGSEGGPAPASRPPGGTETVLLVDDETALLGMAKEMLEGLGYQVVARASSVDALEAFRARPDRFDLVITDLAMPNMTGEQLSRAIRSLRPEIPLILCTGYSEVLSQREMARSGIRATIMKPFSISEMAATIRSVLDRQAPSGGRPEQGRP